MMTISTTAFTGFVYHEDYLKHDTGHHPENAERLVSIMRKLREVDITEKLRTIVPATSRGFGLFTDVIKNIAETNRKGRIAMALEGGYNLNTIAESAFSVFTSLLSNASEIKKGEKRENERMRERVEEIKKVQREY